MWLLRLLILIILIGGLLISPISTFAGTTADVTVTARGYIVGVPGGFTVTYVSDFEVRLDWILGVGASATMIRAAYGHVPTSRTDGYLVYNGTATSFNDTAITLAAPDIVYYRAWSQRADGLWEEVGSQADTEDLMSASFLFLGLILLGVFLTWFSSRVKNILVAFSAGLVWWGIAFWLFFSSTPIYALSDDWAKVLVWIFVMLGFVPFVLHMNVEVKKEMRDKFGNTYTFNEQASGKPDLSTKTSGYDSYRKELRKRLRR